MKLTSEVKNHFDRFLLRRRKNLIDSDFVHACFCVPPDLVTMCLLLHSCIFPRQVTPIFQCVSASSLNWRPTMTSMQCIVSRSFEATAENTLTLASGTVLEIVSDLNPDWWYVKSQDGQEGYFPSTCCLRFATEKSLPPGWQKHMSPDNREKNIWTHRKSISVLMIFSLFVLIPLSHICVLLLLLMYSIHHYTSI